MKLTKKNGIEKNEIKIKDINEINEENMGRFEIMSKRRVKNDESSEKCANYNYKKSQNNSKNRIISKYKKNQRQYMI